MHPKRTLFLKRWWVDIKSNFMLIKEIVCEWIGGR